MPPPLKAIPCDDADAAFLRQGQADGSVERIEVTIIPFNITDQRRGGVVLKEVVDPQFDIEMLRADPTAQVNDLSGTGVGKVIHLAGC